ncbi:MAG: hypothetical protein A3I12_06905 [Gammaproteobacteria bacterium RIFCSPLOWO2_02_FULL_38_11]|nr:MAG: hypothetical protein A2W47_02415 [Gammaproteobacteria bacterium RIFCSPHIGHO2_12_38_15]OGT67872.1 MAG: hypothetical protein A3I12_06905 [Gammaproteobacteria bacterium RIFCSPLOWO2_02_FULL_38_11]
MLSSTITIRLTNTLKTKLEKLAESTHRSKSFLAAEAIDDYISLHEWQINEIKKGLQEANAGDFLEHTKIKKYWRKKRENSLDKSCKSKSKAY